MDNTRRLEVYLRDRTELTPAQRRRLGRYATRAANDVVVRASRQRKTMERQARRQLRVQAENFIAGMRRGWFRQSIQSQVRSTNTLAAIRRALAKDET